MPSLTQLEYIIALDKVKHFGRAAQACHVSQPSLSAQIQKAEEELGLIIFDRSKKPILTTDQGHKIINQAKKVLAAHSQLKDISRSDAEASGRFHLGVIPTLSSYIVPLFIESFSKNFPKVQLKISEYKTSEIIDRLYDDALDGGLLVTPLEDEKLIERTLFIEPFQAFVSDNHSFYNKNSLSEKDLDGETLWLLNEGHCFRNQVLRFCSLKGQNTVLDNVSFESGSLETLINLVRNGKGYTLLPQLATTHLSTKEIKNNLKPFKKPIPSRQVSLVHSRSFYKEKIIDGLVESITTQLPTEIENLKQSRLEIIKI